jgi:hypothetical protein
VLASFLVQHDVSRAEFYSEIQVGSLGSCITYTVEPDKELLNAHSAHALPLSIIDKITIFLYEFDEPRFRNGMRLLWRHDENRFFVRDCKRLDVTERLDFPNATIVPQEQKAHPTELSAETQTKDDMNVMFIMESKADSYEYVVLCIAGGLCSFILVSRELCVVCCSLSISGMMSS